MPDETIRDEIVVLMKDGNGYFDHDRLSLKYLKNVVPSIADRLTLHLDDEGLAVYLVEQRYLADLRLVDGGQEDGCFWVLIVAQHDEDHSSELDQTLRAIYREDFDKTWKGKAIEPAPAYEPVPPPPYPKSKRSSRKNQDPENWTPERKEALRIEREARREKPKTKWGDP